MSYYHQQDMSLPIRILYPSVRAVRQEADQRSSVPVTEQLSETRSFHGTSATSAWLTLSQIPHSSISQWQKTNCSWRIYPVYPRDERRAGIEALGVSVCASRGRDGPDGYKGSGLAFAEDGKSTSFSTPEGPQESGLEGRSEGICRWHWRDQALVQILENRGNVWTWSMTVYFRSPPQRMGIDGHSRRSCAASSLTMTEPW
ncbi:hypothetical protein EJ03DRAFT_148984 [Teratosphaeria nubilosa]|uniref:Uncharacterized protein n=1 Tax=Teratosphaeria nubilosa TaxID=161662 RepID=A0A6G1L4U1_9PEZI|nr:hypothetical protein EJ03DRAFT_148984 [Teratosphaeria nubilosa]